MGSMTPREAFMEAWSHFRGDLRLATPGSVADAFMSALPDGWELVPPDAGMDLQTERDMAEAYYRTLETHLRTHGCDHDFAEVANADGRLA